MFSLSKWYCDSVTDDGDVFIGYSANLKWGAVAMNYASLLDYRGSHGPEVSFSLRREMPPKAERDTCRWSSRALRLNAVWKATQPAISDVVYAQAGGVVEWWCGWPAADAQVRIHGKPAMAGCGYVEHLHMTVPPWQLPIRELRWGHFMGESEYAVWIDWTGDYTRTFVFHNGQRYADSSISNDRVTLQHGSIELDCGRTLRDGTIGSTSLAIIRGAVDLFPARVLQMKETKWRSAAVLRRPGVRDVHGWAIHESVVWPKV
jgi:hypothetical protein